MIMIIPTLVDDTHDTYDKKESLISTQRFLGFISTQRFLGFISIHRS